MTLPAAPEPGDIACCSMGGDAGRAIRILQGLNGDGFRDYEHAFVYLGGGQVLQAEPGGAAIRPLGSYRQIIWSTGLFPPLTAEARTLIPGIAAAMQGIPYSVLDYGALTLRRLHIPAPGLRAYIRSTGHMICSQLADRFALLLGWHLFADGRWEGDVTPGALADRFIELGGKPL